MAGLEKLRAQAHALYMEEENELLNDSRGSWESFELFLGEDQFLIDFLSQMREEAPSLSKRLKNLWEDVQGRVAKGNYPYARTSLEDLYSSLEEF